MSKMKDLSISALLLQAGFSHCRFGGKGSLYVHTVWRTDDGALVGYFTADQACDFLRSNGYMR